MDKRLGSLAEAVSPIGDGATVMIGGFGGSGAPIELIHALIDKGPKNLTVINNNAGNGHVGIAAMIEQGLVAKMICSFPRSSDPRVFNEKYLAGEIELELVPQGTLAERIRAGGAGIPAFFLAPIIDVGESEYMTGNRPGRVIAPVLAQGADTGNAQGLYPCGFCRRQMPTQVNKLPVLVPVQQTCDL